MPLGYQRWNCWCRCQIREISSEYLFDNFLCWQRVGPRNAVKRWVNSRKFRGISHFQTTTLSIYWRSNYPLPAGHVRNFYPTSSAKTPRCWKAFETGGRRVGAKNSRVQRSQPSSGKNKVGLSGQGSHMHSISITQGMQQSADHQFWPGVFAADPAHDPTLFGG